MDKLNFKLSIGLNSIHSSIESIIEQQNKYYEEEEKRINKLDVKGFRLGNDVAAIHAALLCTREVHKFDVLEYMNRSSYAELCACIGDQTGHVDISNCVRKVETISRRVFDLSNKDNHISTNIEYTMFYRYISVDDTFIRDGSISAEVIAHHVLKQLKQMCIDLRINAYAEIGDCKVSCNEHTLLDYVPYYEYVEGTHRIPMQDGKYAYQRTTSPGIDRIVYLDLHPEKYQEQYNNIMKTFN